MVRAWVDERVEIGTEGGTITYQFADPDGTSFDIDNYYLPTKAYQSEFSAAGFASFDWVMPEVSTEGQPAFPPGFWAAFLEAPPLASFTAFAGVA